MVFCYFSLIICFFGLVLEVGLLLAVGWLLAVGLLLGVLFLFLVVLESDFDLFVSFRVEVEYLGVVGFFCFRGGVEFGFGFGLFDWLLDFVLLILLELFFLDGLGGLDLGLVLIFEGLVFIEFIKFEEELFWNCGGRFFEGR